MISSMPSALKPPDYERNENKISVTLWISNYAFSQTGLRKSGPFGAVEIEAAVPVVSTPWRMG
jgi:hypothetical protein